MYHIVSHGELGKALDFPSLVGRLFLLSLFSLTASEHVALCDDSKFQKRVLKAPVEVSVGDHNLSGLHLSAVLIRQIGLQPVLPQIAGQTAGPCPGTSQKDCSVFLLLPPGQILDQHLKAVLIGAHALGLNAVLFFHRKACHPLIKP